MLTDDEILEILVLIEKHEILQAVKFVQYCTGLNLKNAGLKVKSLAKEHLKMEILKTI